jgi:hypothetical protein
MTTTTERSSEWTEHRTVEIEQSIGRVMKEARRLLAATAIREGSIAEDRQRYEDTVGTALAEMELDVQLARAALDADEADSTEDVRRAMGAIEESARRWLDELAVRTRLAEMETDDRVTATMHRIDRARAEVRRATARIDDAIESDLDAMRTIARHALHDIRAAVGDSIRAVFRQVP